MAPLPEGSSLKPGALRSPGTSGSAPGTLCGGGAALSQGVGAESRDSRPAIESDVYKRQAQDYEPKVDISYTAGQHAFKFGLSYNRYTKNQMLYGDEQGDYGFNAISNDGIMDMLMLSLIHI